MRGGRGAEPHRWWQAEHWISALRDQVTTPACLRPKHPTGYAKGAHPLSHELPGPLETALVRSLDEAELRRALEAVVASPGRELELTTRIRPRDFSPCRPNSHNLAGHKPDH